LVNSASHVAHLLSEAGLHHEAVDSHAAELNAIGVHP
jgi:hypothetical protein